MSFVRLYVYEKGKESVSEAKNDSFRGEIVKNNMLKALAQTQFYRRSFLFGRSVGAAPIVEYSPWQWCILSYCIVENK